MSAPVLWLLLFFGLALCSVLVLLAYLVRNYWDPQGKGAPGKTARRLRRFARFRGGRVLSDIQLPAGDKTVAVQNLLIMPFGILMVHTCGMRGEYYGQIGGETWTLVQGEDRTAIPNPVAQQERAASALRELFAKNKVYKVPIEQIVYLSSRAKRTSVFITHEGQLLFRVKLGSYLEKEKYAQDLGVDVARVAQVIQDAAL